MIDETEPEDNGLSPEDFGRFSRSLERIGQLEPRDSIFLSAWMGKQAVRDPYARIAEEAPPDFWGNES